MLDVRSDAGRMIRPLIVVEDGEMLYQPHHFDGLMSRTMTYSRLIELGIIDVLDPDEEFENAFISVRPGDVCNDDYTHCEIEPGFVFS